MTKKENSKSNRQSSLKTEKIVYEDPDTGNLVVLEVDADGKVIRESKPIKKFARENRGFAKLFEEASSYIAHQKLSGQQLSILFYILGNLDFDNFVRVSQKDIAEELGLRFQHVSRAMLKLVQVGILEEGERVNKSKTYRLNPKIAYKGRGDKSKSKVLSFSAGRKGEI